MWNADLHSALLLLYPWVRAGASRNNASCSRGRAVIHKYAQFATCIIRNYEVQKSVSINIDRDWLARFIADRGEDRSRGETAVTQERLDQRSLVGGDGQIGDAVSIKVAGDDFVAVSER